MVMHDLPVNRLLPQLRRTLENTSSAVLAAPPGSGKTTLVPLAMLDQPWLRGKKIVMLEPRRLATRAAASRMAQLLGQPVGETVGYQIRMDRRIGPKTRIEVVTEGILTRRLQQDPELSDVGLVIFDEFHERSLHADLALALCLDVLAGLREDLRLLVMSATLDTSRVAQVLGGAPVLQGEGRSFPVESIYLEREAEGRIVDVALQGVSRALQQTDGDLLVFLPGTGEIRQAESRLRDKYADALLLAPLYGELDSAAQDLALQPSADGRRRVVLATSIAETSLTIEGIDTVVDTGWSRLPRFDPNNGLTRLETLRVSRASADQRAGRAGRLGPGRCFRMWTRGVHARLAAFSPPELLEADLASLVLELARWGVADPNQLAWLDSPPRGSYNQARELLVGLEALDQQGRITPLGEAMAGLALHPRLAHMLIKSSPGALQSALDLAGLLAERDILRRRAGESLPLDVDYRLELIQRWRNGEARNRLGSDVDSRTIERIDRLGRQWRRQLKSLPDGLRGQANTTGQLLALAYPDRIAGRRGSGLGYQLASGRGVKIPAEDLLGNESLLVVPVLDAGQRDGRAYLAARIALAEIRQILSPMLVKRARVMWDEQRSAVLAREEEMLGALCLAHRERPDSDPEAIRQAMLSGITQMGLSALPWTDELRQWQTRVSLVREWLPEECGLPDLSDGRLLQSLEAWLGPWLDGLTRREHLSRLDLARILHAQLDWNQQQRLDALAPTHIRVPSGSNKRLQYQLDQPPILAVRLQEMFGMQQTPAVCNGAVPVMLHLLSPAQRPIQVTQDLAGFWTRTYAEVRKELKGRYPKHYWPDDPTQATPTARVRPPKH